MPIIRTSIPHRGDEECATCWAFGITEPPVYITPAEEE